MSVQSKLIADEVFVELSFIGELAFVENRHLLAKGFRIAAEVIDLNDCNCAEVLQQVAVALELP